MRIGLVPAAACLVMAGCSSPTHLESRFDPNEVAWFVKSGTNSIEGSAIVRSDSGTAKTCAAQTVVLFPVSAYARERMRYLYGNDTDGFNRLILGRPADFDIDDPRYQSTARTTRCDARGHFAFLALPDGAYFLVATVTWKEKTGLGLEQGGYLMQRVDVQTGETKQVLLAH